MILRAARLIAFFMHPQLDHLAHRLQTFDLMLLPQLGEFGEDVVYGGQQSQPERGAAEQVRPTHTSPHGASSRQ
jgi:hypothetical protein